MWNSTKPVESFVLVMRWHEHRSCPYRDVYLDKDGTRMVRALMADVCEHNRYGREFEVVAVHTDGLRSPLTGWELGKLGSGT
jgi:hypothetical protein